MQKYEYKQITSGLDDKVKIIDQINALGSDGWRLISVVADKTRPWFHAFLEREIITDFNKA